MSKVINAFTPILAGAELGRGAKRNFSLAKFPRKSPGALAFVGPDFIDTRGVVLASIANAIIGVELAPRAFESTRANAPEMLHLQKYYCNKDCMDHIRESASLDHFTLCIVDARISIACIDYCVAVLPVVSGRADALVVPIWQGPASRPINTRVVVAQVAFGQYLGIDGSWWEKKTGALLNHERAM